jgi:O-methyltransferase
MPFTKTRSSTRRLSHNNIVVQLHRLVRGGYILRNIITDQTYYSFSYLFYFLKRDTWKAQKIKDISMLRHYSMVGRGGLLATYSIASDMEKCNIDGCFVECGVARGGCSAIMALVAHKNKSNRKMWLFDSFEGLPVATEHDDYYDELFKPDNKSAAILAPGYCKGSYEEVQNLLFAKLRLNRKNIFLVKGWFQDTLPKVKDNVGPISFLRLDGDWYESTKCCLENLFDNVVKGGYIYIDDYETVGGCKKALQEFLNSRGISVRFIYDNRGGVYFKKL